MKKQLKKSGKTFDSLKKLIGNGRLIVKSQQRFRSVKHNIFTEEVNKISLNETMIREYSQSIL